MPPAPRGATTPADTTFRRHSQPPAPAATAAAGQTSPTTTLTPQEARSFLMPSLFRSTSFLAGVAAAGALAGGLLMAPPSTQAADGAVMLATQDSKTVTMSITGVALAPDGSPAA